MSAERSLDNLMHRLRMRVRLLLAERYALFGGCVGAVACSVVVLLSGRYPALIDYRLWAGIVVAGVVGGCAYGLLRGLDDLSVALAADRRTGMKERLSTAVSFPDEGELPDMGRAVISDADEHFARLRSAEIFRHRFGLPHSAFCLAGIVLAAVLIIPMIPALHSKERLREIRVMKDEGKKIVKIARDVKTNVPRDEDMKRLASRLEKLGRRMQSSRMPKKQAMLSARRLSKDIKEAQDRLTKENSTSKSMEQALTKALNNMDLSKSAQQILANAQKLAKMSPGDLEKLAKMSPGDLQKLAKMSPKDLQKLLDEIKKAQMLAKAGGT